MVLLDETLDFTPYALRVIRKIVHEITDYIHTRKPSYLKIMANSDKKRNLYETLLSKYKIKGYMVHQDGECWHLYKLN